MLDAGVFGLERGRGVGAVAEGVAVARKLVYVLSLLELVPDWYVDGRQGALVTGSGIDGLGAVLHGSEWDSLVFLVGWRLGWRKRGVVLDAGVAALRAALGCEGTLSEEHLGLGL